jgi:hypothetical protein
MGIYAEVVETETHHHSNECWFGKNGSPTPEVDEATKNSLTTFQVDSGNNDWGTAICILGSNDTPCETNKQYFDMNEILITATERTNEPILFRITWGNTEAEGITAEHSSVTAFYPTATARTAPIYVQGKRIPAGSKVWANCKCASNTGTVNFLFGIHEYDE